MSDTIIFDLDGVLLDSYKAHMQCYLQLCKSFGIHANAKDFRRAVEGKTHEFYRNLGIPQQLDDTVWFAFKESFPNYSCSVFPGVPKMLSRLRKTRKLAIATFNRRAIIEEQFKEYLGMFDMVLTGDDTKLAKSDSLRAIVATLGKAVFVGDTRWDYDSSQQAQVPFIGVAWGWQDHSQETRFPVYRTVSSLSRALSSTKRKDL